MAIQIDYKCTQHGLTRLPADPATIAAYSADYDFAHFEFCPDWEGLNVTIAFEHSQVGEILALPNENNTVAIPVEVNAIPGFWVSAIGTNADGKRITTVRDFVVVNRSAIGVSTYASSPTPDVYAQLYAKINESDGIAQSVRDDADAGVFDGDAATIDVGTVETVEPNVPAEVTNSGDRTTAVFDFKIPKGEQGDPGATGPQGNPGVVVDPDPGMFCFSVNAAGHLILTCASGEVPAFSVDENGHLVYTFN